MIIKRILCTGLLAMVPCFADHLSVPSGTELSVRTNEAIDSKVAREGDTFDAQFVNAVTTAEGRTVIPRGAPAKLTLREVDKGGATGTRELMLDLESVSVDGRRYYVGATAEVESRKEGIGKNKRTGVYTGGGAALGAIIGAIAGGGKGAAIGAIAGAGAGAAAQVMTRGEAVRVPAETVLNFRLDRELRLATR